MISIEPIRPCQIAAAKLVIATVARPYYGSDKTVREFAAMLDEEKDRFVEPPSYKEDPYEDEISLQIDLIQ